MLHDVSADPQAITLIGMSGVGKSWFANRMADWGWTHYCCDEEIALNYLVRELKENGATVDEHNYMKRLSEYVGQIGNPQKGGLDLETFKQRQENYIQAETASLEAFLNKPKGGKIVNDSTGSLCEIDNLHLIRSLAESSLFVYVRATPEHEEILLERARNFPKPLYFPSKLFDMWLQDYMRENGLSQTEDIDPDDFSRSIFPTLFHYRRPLYEDLADKFGITVSAEELSDIQTEAEFYALIARQAEAGHAVAG